MTAAAHMPDPAARPQGAEDEESRAIRIRAKALDDLDRLQAVAMELVESLRQRVTGSAPRGADPGFRWGDPALAFSRLVKLFGQIILLQDDILEQRSAKRAAKAAAASPPPRHPPVQKPAAAEKPADGAAEGRKAPRPAADMPPRISIAEFRSKGTLEEALAKIHAGLCREAAALNNGSALKTLSTLSHLSASAPATTTAGPGTAQPAGAKPPTAAKPPNAGPPPAFRPRAALLAGGSLAGGSLGGGSLGAVQDPPWRTPQSPARGKPASRGPPRR